MVSTERNTGKEEGLMSTEDIELGPIDYLVVEWPAGSSRTARASSISSI